MARQVSYTEKNPQTFYLPVPQGSCYHPLSVVDIPLVSTVHRKELSILFLLSLEFRSQKK